MSVAVDTSHSPSNECDRICRLLASPESRTEGLGAILIATELENVPPEAVANCLLDPGEPTRIRAVEALLRMRDRGVEGLVSALDPAQPIAVRISSAMALGRLGPVAAAASEDLAACIETDDAVLRLHAGLALSRIGPEAIPYLRPLLHSSDEEAVRTAASALGRMGERARDTLDELQPLATESPSPVVRITCSQAITAISGETSSGIRETLSLFDSEDPQIRQVCLDAVREVGVADETIREKVREKLRDPVGRVRGAAALTTARIELDAQTALPVLLPLLTDDDLEVRASAAMALAHYGAKASDAVEALTSLREAETPHLRAVADAALKRIKETPPS